MRCRKIGIKDGKGYKTTFYGVFSSKLENIL